MEATAITAPAAAADSDALPERLSWDAICQRYPNQWVVLIDIVDEDFQPAAGRVMSHSADRAGTGAGFDAAWRIRNEAGRFFTGVQPGWRFRSHVLRNG